MDFSRCLIENGLCVPWKLWSSIKNWRHFLVDLFLFFRVFGQTVDCPANGGCRGVVSYRNPEFINLGHDIMSKRTALTWTLCRQRSNAKHTKVVKMVSRRFHCYVIPSKRNVSTSALMSESLKPSPFSSLAVIKMSRKSNLFFCSWLGFFSCNIVFKAPVCLYHN